MADSTLPLRGWQSQALQLWNEAGHRGIVSVVTGGGKTVFALACIRSLRPTSTLVVVPTAALLEQWWVEAASYFNLELDEINLVNGALKYRVGTINIAILNTAARLAPRIRDKRCLLIVDECHKAAAPQFRAALDVQPAATLGLSATPERPYDDGLDAVLVPALGPVLFRYGYADALRDGVVVPFHLKNIVFDLEAERQADYNRVTKAIAVAVARDGPESEKAIALYLKRARIVNLSMNRVRLAARLVALNRGRRTLIFHEDIEACNVLEGVLSEMGVRSGVYHSGMKVRDRAVVLEQFRRGTVEVLVTCRALDEGFNVPEAEIGIIAASTATRRQRIQRLGRVLRPSTGKLGATVYSLVATTPEISRLKDEEGLLEGIASVTWSRA